MGKAERMRAMQHEINRLREEARQLKAKLFQYRKRDRPQAGDFIKQKGGKINGTHTDNS